jgi:uncharacterized protein (DUF1015 family)
MRACRAHFNPIFSFFPDPKGDVSWLLEVPHHDPLLQVRDDNGVEHTIWRITDSSHISSIVSAMRDRPVFIADGHHRYETSLNYLKEMEEKGIPLPEDHPARRTLMYFTPLEDEGLVILPVHKMVKDLNGFCAEDFLKETSRWFQISTFEFDSTNEMDRRSTFLSSLRESWGLRPSIGVAIQGEKAYRLLTPRDLSTLENELHYLPECLRGLDVTLLHEVIFKWILGIDISDPKDTHLSYVHDVERCFRRVRDGRAQIAFLMNPTRIEDLKAVASSRCKMPQKATYFYPKLLSGLVMNIMEGAGISR